MAEHPRGDVIAENQPRRFRPFLVVERILSSGDLAPTGEAARRYFHQNDVTLVCPSEAGFEKMNQRHPDLAKCDLFYDDSHFPMRYTPASGVLSKPITANPPVKHSLNSSPILN